MKYLENWKNDFDDVCTSDATSERQNFISSGEMLKYFKEDNNRGIFSNDPPPFDEIIIQLCMIESKIRKL